MFFDSAADVTKQLITVATGILGLSVTFLKDIVKEAPQAHFWPLRVAWVFYLLSIICGIWTLMAITGSINHLVEHNDPVPIVSSMRLPAGLQPILFGLGTMFLVYYGMVAIGELQKPKPQLPPPDPRVPTVD